MRGQAAQGFFAGRHPAPCRSVRRQDGQSASAQQGGRHGAAPLPPPKFDSAHEATAYKLHEEGKKLEERLLEGRAPIWKQLKATELYDHQDDTAAWQADKYENINLAATADKSLVASLSKQLHASFGFPDKA